MYWNEGHHARPHFHARYSGHVASVDFNGEVIAGSLPPRALRLVADWAALHADGVVGHVSFEQREWRGVFEALADPAYFAQVRVDPELGTIAWPNGADLAPEPLYEAALDRAVSQRRAADRRRLVRSAGCQSERRGAGGPDRFVGTSATRPASAPGTRRPRAGRDYRFSFTAVRDS
jgi:hypothetical protein